MARRDRIPNGVGMVGAPPLLQLSDGEVTDELISILTLFQQSIVRKLNGRLSWGNGDHATQSGNIDGQWVEVVTPSVANTEFVVPHGLGRVPSGYLVMRRSQVAELYDSNIGGWNDRNIYLKCDTGDATIRFVLV